MSAPTSTTSARDRTRTALLALVRQGVATTRGELVAQTGYSRSTVGHAVGQLIDAGLIEEAEQTEKGPGSGRGRPGLVLRAVATGGHVGAIDIGHRHVAVAVGDSLGRELARARIDGDLDAEGKLDRAASALANLCAEAGIPSLRLVCAGIPKPINLVTGLVDAPRVGDGWTGISPAAELERRLGTPTHAVNDTVLGARGEHALGAARGVDDFLYIKVSHGIGASLFLDGRPYSGVNGIVGSIGHCRLDGHTELCRCGRRGCLEAVSSLVAVHDQLAATHPGADPAGVLHEQSDTAVRVLDGAGRAMGRLVADFCSLLTPARVVLGGALGAGYPAFLRGVAWAVDEYASAAAHEATSVVAAELGESAELLGGLALASDRVTAGVRVAG